MSIITPTQARRRRWRSAADKGLRAASRLWVCVAVAGQWIFVAYIASTYGRYALRGELLSWNRTLAHGYESGNAIGNSALAMHLLFAAVISFAGALQLVPWLRARHPVVHRWIGRIYVLIALVMGVTGLYLLTADRVHVGDTAEHVATDINAVLIILCAAMAWRRAVARDMRSHRRWALRLFLVVNGVWFLRVTPLSVTGPFVALLGFASYALPLGVLELYLWTKERAGALGRTCTATVLLLHTIAMGVGIFEATTRMWLPTVKVAADNRKSIANALYATIATRGVDEAVRQYHAAKAAEPGAYNFDDERELRLLGAQLVRSGKLEEAIRVLQLAVEAFPRSSKVHDRLARAYLAAGHTELAVANYRIALELDPNDDDAAQELQRLTAPR